MNSVLVLRETLCCCFSPGAGDGTQGLVYARQVLHPEPQPQPGKSLKTD
jgi:hypothetical protein